MLFWARVRHDSVPNLYFPPDLVGSRTKRQLNARGTWFLTYKTVFDLLLHDYTGQWGPISEWIKLSCFIFWVPRSKSPWYILGDRACLRQIQTHTALNRLLRCGFWSITRRLYVSRSWTKSSCNSKMGMLSPGLHTSPMLSNRYVDIDHFFDDFRLFGHSGTILSREKQYYLLPTMYCSTLFLALFAKDLYSGWFSANEIQSGI